MRSSFTYKTLGLQKKCQKTIFFNLLEENALIGFLILTVVQYVYVYIYIDIDIDIDIQLLHCDFPIHPAPPSFLHIDTYIWHLLRQDDGIQQAGQVAIILWLSKTLLLTTTRRRQQQSQQRPPPPQQQQQQQQEENNKN